LRTTSVRWCRPMGLQSERRRRSEHWRQWYVGGCCIPVAAAWGRTLYGPGVVPVGVIMLPRLVGNLLCRWEADSPNQSSLYCVVSHTMGLNSQMSGQQPEWRVAWVALHPAPRRRWYLRHMVVWVTMDAVMSSSGVVSSSSCSGA
jgi:hypothetical protein